MEWIVSPSKLYGSIEIPGSKSHTIRAVLISALASGESRLNSVLLSSDTEAALTAAGFFGAESSFYGDELVIKGRAGDVSGVSGRVFLGNSGTSMRLFTGAAALGDAEITFDGDESLRRRPMKPLLTCLRDLGAEYRTKGKGDVPFTVKGPLRGGEARIEGTTSQYLSSLLLSLPLASGNSRISVTGLNESPYIDITLYWLDKARIDYRCAPDYSEFQITGGQSYPHINEKIPGDFSSAAFPGVAACITGSRVEITNLDFDDPQGDKEFFNIINRFGADVQVRQNSVVVDASERVLKGIELDLNSMPDALPAAAVLGCYAEGETVINNVAQARIKECDRIDKMAQELGKMGADIQTFDNGMVVRNSRLSGTELSGETGPGGPGDHRVVMALAVAGLAAEGRSIISAAESASVTFPGFEQGFRGLGAAIERKGEKQG